MSNGVARAAHLRSLIQVDLAARSEPSRCRGASRQDSSGLAGGVGCKGGGSHSHPGGEWQELRSEGGGESLSGAPVVRARQTGGSNQSDRRES